MSTFFTEMKKSFVDVPVVDQKIDTADFLEASESLVKLFDLLGSSAFAVVQKDMTGNITKIRAKLLADPAGSATLQDLVLSEAGTKTKTATQGLLWLSRGLQFTAQAMRETVNSPDLELTKTFTDAYGKTLSKYHGMLVKPIFKLAMKACPYRKDFFAKLGADQDVVTKQLEAWLEALENIVDIIVKFFASGDYGKGL
ncbi:glycolipid transfer protein domain-containing protein [Scheffersomyces xylosifermentans]|uniref:glycolipid transfer protein domain-containing protein n=1 Tax=Scheffersomyces xylosifermentans TaxID=1304137 RepID=UPI00315D87A5